MGGGHHEAEPVMKVSEEEMTKERVPLEWRDFCAHKLIPLNKCRRKNFFLPWRCEDERHAYEECQYSQYMRRVKEMNNILKEEKAKAAQE